MIFNYRILLNGTLAEVIALYLPYPFCVASHFRLNTNYKTSLDSYQYNYLDYYRNLASL